MNQEAKSQEQRYKERQERLRADSVLIQAFALAVQNLEDSILNSKYLLKLERNED